MAGLEAELANLKGSSPSIRCRVWADHHETHAFGFLGGEFGYTLNKYAVLPEE